MTSKELLNRQKMVNFRNWQDVWLKHIHHIAMFKQLSKLLPVLKKLKLASFKETVSAKKIQSAWRKYLVLKGC